jgi:hypothetical protein
MFKLIRFISPKCDNKIVNRFTSQKSALKVAEKEIRYEKSSNLNLKKFNSTLKIGQIPVKSLIEKETTNQYAIIEGKILLKEVITSKLFNIVTILSTENMLTQEEQDYFSKSSKNFQIIDFKTMNKLSDLVKNQGVSGIISFFITLNSK